MKKLLVVALALIVLLCGCTATGVPQSNYDELEEEYESLENKYDKLKKKYDDLESDYDDIFDKYSALQSEMDDEAEETDDYRFDLTQWIACELVLGTLHSVAYPEDNYDIDLEFETYVEVYELNDLEQAMVWAGVQAMLLEWE